MRDITSLVTPADVCDITVVSPANVWHLLTCVMWHLLTCVTPADVCDTCWCVSPADVCDTCWRVWHLLTCVTPWHLLTCVTSADMCDTCWHVWHRDICWHVWHLLTCVTPWHLLTCVTPADVCDTMTSADMCDITVVSPAVVRESDDVVGVAVQLRWHHHLEQCSLTLHAVDDQSTSEEPVTTVLAGHTDTQIDRQTDRQTFTQWRQCSLDGQTDRQTDRQTFTQWRQCSTDTADISRQQHTVSRCQKTTSGLHGAVKINRGRHIDHPTGHNSIRTNQCQPPTIPLFFLQAGCPSCRLTNSVKALKATSAFGLGRRRYSDSIQ